MSVSSCSFPVHFILLNAGRVLQDLKGQNKISNIPAKEIFAFSAEEYYICNMGEEIYIYNDKTLMDEAAAQKIAEEIESFLNHQPRCSIALAGGGTPRGVYTALGNKYQSLLWERIDIFWSDERCVPPSHEQSNYKIARETLLLKVPLQESAIHRIPCEKGSPEDAARHYEKTILDLTGTTGSLIDIVLLGVGKDGHTASLFPWSPLLDEMKRFVMPEYHPGLAPKVPRVTFTLPLINQSSTVCFLVSGPKKGELLSSVMGPHLNGIPREKRSKDLPFSLVEGEEKTLWFINIPRP